MPKPIKPLRLFAALAGLLLSALPTAASAVDPFLMVVAQWRSHDDVDLRVTDPEGRSFGRRLNNVTGADYPGVLSEFVLDLRRGPAAEIWIAPVATPGIYTITLALFTGTAQNVKVQPRVIYPGGTFLLPVTVLSVPKIPVALRFELKPDGTLSVVP